MKVTVNTTQVEFVHGKKPSGFGCWVFIGADDSLHIRGNYSKAKAQAIKEAKKRGWNELKVGS